MNKSIRTALGIKDPHLELKQNLNVEAIEDQKKQIVIHLIQSYPMHCPICGRLMVKNGFKEVNYLGPSLHYERTI